MTYRMRRLMPLLVLLVGCDIFYEDHGGDGQPCYEHYIFNQMCNSGLVCNDDICLPPLGLGERCFCENAKQEYHFDLLCEGELICRDRRCEPRGEAGEPCEVYDYDYEYYDDGDNSCVEGCDCENAMCECPDADVR